MSGEATSTPFWITVLSIPLSIIDLTSSGMSISMMTSRIIASGVATDSRT